MRSLIITEVEHGETTDPLNSMMKVINNLPIMMVRGVTIIDQNVRVDVGDHYVVRSWDNPSKEN